MLDPGVQMNSKMKQLKDISLNKDNKNYKDNLKNLNEENQLEIKNEIDKDGLSTKNKPRQQ